jgi:hypothetical protein
MSHSDLSTRVRANSTGPRKLARFALTSAAVMAALVALYVGIAVVLSVAHGIGHLIFAIIAYALIAILLPIGVSMRLAQRDDWTMMQAVRVAAALCVGVQLLMLPVALTAMAM